MKRQDVIASVDNLRNGMILHDGDCMRGIADCIELSSFFRRTTRDDDKLVALPMRCPSAVRDCVIVGPPALEYTGRSFENIGV